MTTAVRRPHADLTIEGGTAEANGGTVNLDAMQVPYGVATVTVPLVDIGDVEDIDPREDIRGVIVAGDDQLGTSRTFDMSVRSRRVDHRARNIEITLATDEALLQTYAPVTVDTGARAFEASLRDVCDYVLDKIGATLEAGAYDADVTAAWQVTNLLSNPSFETNTTGWVAAGVASGIARSTSIAPPFGSAYCNITSGSAGNAYMGRSDSVRVNGGEVYTFSAYLRPNVANRQGRVFMRWLNAAGATIRESFGFFANLPTTDWTRVHVTATAPLTAATVQMFPGFAAGAGGEVCRVDSCMLNEGDLTTYIDGSLADDAYYSYEWDDGTDSSSTRTPFVERDPDLFLWPPDVSGWEFLAPLTAASGLRLFCNEAREWRLIDPAEYTAPGVLTLSDATSTEGTDEIALGDPEVYCTGVAITYAWTDRNGVRRERIDSAGSPGLILRRTFNRPWPGAGVAAWMLARRAGQGRVQEVTALARWNATPGMEVSTSLPGTIAQLGQLQAIEWGLATGLMNVKARALTDIIPESWLAEPGTWADADPLLTWEDA